MFALYTTVDQGVLTLMGRHEGSCIRGLDDDDGTDDKHSTLPQNRAFG